jgi:hypothetical protein
MGQPITVIEKRGQRHDVVRFELNRSLTGMGHHRYRSRADAAGNTPADELARRLFDRGGVQAVHIYSNIVDLDLAPRADTGGMQDIIRDLFLYYGAPSEPEPSDEETVPETTTST